MANFNALKNFFSKIAKSGTANGVAKFATNYGDDVAKGVTSNLDDVGRLYGESMLTPKSEAFIDALDDSPLFKSSGKQASQLGFDGTPLSDSLPDDIPDSIPIEDLVEWRNDGTYYAGAPITPYEFVSNYNKSRFGDPRPFDVTADGLIDPTLYKMDGTPDYNAMNIDPLDYGQVPELVDSLEYPDGFTNPEDFARYYDDLARGVSTVDNVLPEYTQNDFDRDTVNAYQALRVPGEDRSTTLSKFFKKYGYSPF